MASEWQQTQELVYQSQTNAVPSSATTHDTQAHLNRETRRNATHCGTDSSNTGLANSGLGATCVETTFASFVKQQTQQSHSFTI
jgi:hypothetical protein